MFQEKRVLESGHWHLSRWAKRSHFALTKSREPFRRSPEAERAFRSSKVTRSRAYKKNDQAFVEQKNGAVVCRLMGYGRFDGVETARVMGPLYAAARLYVNFFQPSFKLKEKRREGAKVIKRYHA